MIMLEKRRKTVCGIMLAAAGLLFGGMANRAQAANEWFLPGGVTNGNTYSWDGPTNWSTTSAGPASTAWVQGNFAEFNNSNTYTVTVNADEQNVGLFQSVTGGNLTINSAGVGDDLDVITAIQGFLADGTVVINSPIVGNGGVAPELTGSLSLFGNNTYTGGTALGDSGNTLTFFNSSSSFGTGGITLNRTNNFSTLLSTGGSAITLANNFSTVVANTGATTDLNFASAANTPVISSGSWTLGTVNLGLRNNGDSTAPLTLSGAISGTGTITFSGANGGNINITGSSAGNTGFTGTAAIGGGAGENAITVSLGAANTLSSATGVTLTGGTLNPDGFTQHMASAPMTLSASSTIDYGAGPSEIDFANSSAKLWTGTLDLANWDPTNATTFLRFGTDATGLTPAQLADIEFDNNPATLGEAQITSTGYVETPEPASLSLLALAGAGLVARRRRRQV
jgi:hypothetical protein